jgi:hypothetical protein
MYWSSHLMANSTLIIDYIGYGTAASRPTTPPVASGVLALYFATDTLVMSGWTGASWVTLTSSVSHAGLGAAINSGTVEINNMVTLTGTNSGTTTIAPGSGTSWAVLNMPTAAGTVTVAAAPAFAGQETILDIKYGATLSTPSLNSGFVAGGGVTAFSPSGSINTIDRLKLISPDGTHWVYMVVSQGGTL